MRVTRLVCVFEGAEPPTLQLLYVEQGFGRASLVVMEMEGVNPS